MSDDYDKIPEHMMISIKEYVEKGRPLGGFLTAVFANDLFRSIGQADEASCLLVPIYVKYIYNRCPGNCHGSYEAVKEWIDKKHKRIRMYSDNRDEI